MHKTLVICLAAATASVTTYASEREIKVDDRLQASADTVNDMRKASDSGIPQDLMDKARCVIVVPGMKKAGFIVGAQYGRGFASCRHGHSGFGSPTAIHIEGGSVGFQIGASETDIVLLVMNDGGMKHLLADKFTLGGDASAAAGPVGRDVSAETDAMMNAELLSYSRSRGLFAGISLEGATLRPDEHTNREIYGHDASASEVFSGTYQPPSKAASFQKALNRK